MVSDENRNFYTCKSVFDSNHEETHHSDGQYDELINNLREKYRRLKSEYSVKDISSTKSLSHEQIHSSNQSLGRQVSYSGTSNNIKQTVDDVVVPFSKRRSRFKPSLEGRSLHPIVEWEGYVERIDEESFVARLVNIKIGDSLPEDEAVFLKSELSEYALPHLDIGAIFRWVIGMQHLPSGQKQRVSQLYFRCHYTHSATEIQSLKERVTILIDSIDWDEPPQAR